MLTIENNTYILNHCLSVTLIELIFQKILNAHNISQKSIHKY